MQKRTWIAGIGAGWGLMLSLALIAFSGIPNDASIEQSKELAPEMELPELIARQIESGNLTCPQAGSLKYEACLLYQSALGIWHNTNFENSCPSTFRPETRRDAQIQTPAPPRQLEPEDARRAARASCFRTIYSILVANTTPILSSTALRVFHMIAARPYQEPGNNAELCIEVRHGICGNQTAVGIAFLEMAGIEARTVKFYYDAEGQRRSHIIVEAMIDGSWRLIDTTYGAYWSANPDGGAPFALASLEQVLGSKHIRSNIIFNTALMPHSLYSATVSFDPFEYLEHNPDIIRGDAGAIGIELTGHEGEEKFENIPNYIGDNIPNRPFSGIQYNLNSEEKNKPIEIVIRISTSALTGDKPVCLCVDSECRPLEGNAEEFRFKRVNPDRVYLKTENDVSYAILDSIRWKVAERK